MRDFVAEVVRIRLRWGVRSEVSRLRLRGFLRAKIPHGVAGRVQLLAYQTEQADVYCE